MLKYIIAVTAALSLPALAVAETPADISAKLQSMLRIVRSQASVSAPEVRMSGVTAYKTSVELKARLTRPVESVSNKEGSFVSKGTTLVTLAPETLKTDMAEAKAALAQRQSDYNSFSKLRKTRDISQSKVTEALSALRQAQARISVLEKEEGYLHAKAPFNAYVNRIPVREGDTTKANETILAELLDPQSFMIRADVPERLLGRFDSGAEVHAESISGNIYKAAITYVGASADGMTRTFPLEAQVKNMLDDNGAAPPPAGLTVSLFVPLKTSDAHRVPSSALALDKDGRIGLKLKENNRVVFYPVDIIDSGSSDGRIYVEGLPATADIIMTGHAYVAEDADITGVPLTPAARH